MNSLIKAIINKYRIYDQLDDFLVYKGRFMEYVDSYRERLLEVIKMVGKDDVRDWTTHDIEQVSKSLTERYSTFYRDQYVKCMRGFIRYSRQRKLTDINPAWIKDDGRVVR